MRRISPLFALALLAVGLLLPIGAAAEIPASMKQAVIDEIGFCSPDAFEGKADRMNDYPYELSESIDPESGLVRWDIYWGTQPDEYGEWLATFGELWFPARGIAAQAEYDLDSDGADEWIVVRAGDPVPGTDLRDYEVSEGAAWLYLDIYEREGDALALSDSVLLADIFDYFDYYVKVFIYEYNGAPRIAFQQSRSVDSWWIDYRVIAYDGQRIRMVGGFGIDSPGDSNLYRVAAYSPFLPREAIHKGDASYEPYELYLNPDTAVRRDFALWMKARDIRLDGVTPDDDMFFDAFDRFLAQGGYTDFEGIDREEALQILRCWVDGGAYIYSFPVDDADDSAALCAWADRQAAAQGLSFEIGDDTGRIVGAENAVRKLTFDADDDSAAYAVLGDAALAAESAVPLIEFDGRGVHDDAGRMILRLWLNLYF